MSSEIERLFQAAASLPKDRQAEYLDGQTKDAAVHREVLSLLAHDELAHSFFGDALQSAASSATQEMDLAPGTRVGPYAIQKMLGRGGMGAVYLAARADGTFEQTVAIKVIQSSSPADFLRERFQHERQILARLSHPNIARLLDGGETPGGLPYFVLEYISGQDIHSYCQRHKTKLRDRLSLFLEVCGAVQYAHEHLVVHRDLKPGNILVGEDGNPKLLDFGIAKVLDSTDSASAQGSTRVLTPEYASPEQVRGDLITTASDIYSLGAVLYCLLSGRPPHSLRGLSPLDAAKAISEQPVPPAAGVPADVGAILDKSLHNDPTRRYRSANELASDIQRFLDGKAVVAVRDSLGYRARKFLRRHWIPASALLAVVVALAVGAGTTLWQARRAQQRFAEVRQLSNKFLFEFEDSIHNLAGATKARQLVVKTAQEYLDRLAVEAADDREVTRELAEAYRKLGDVQGSPLEGNIGDTQAALASYRKAVALRDSLGDERATGTKVRTSYVDALIGLANAESGGGDPARALALSEKAVAVSESWIRSGSSDPDLVTAAAISYSHLSTRQREKGNFEAGIVSAKRSLSLSQQALKLRPEDRTLQRSVAVRYWAVGSAEKVAGHAEEAVAAFTTTVELLRQVAANNPGNVASRRELLGASWLLASCETNLLHKRHQSVEGALPPFEEAWKIGTQLLQEDPANALVEADMTSISIGLGNTLQEIGRARDALDVLNPAIERQERRRNSAPGNRTAAHYLALLHMCAASCYKDLHDLAKALANRRAAMDIFDRLVAANPTAYEYQYYKASNLGDTGEVMVALGDYAGARAKYQEGLKIAQNLPKEASSLDPASLIANIQQAIQRIAQK